MSKKAEPALTMDNAAEIGAAFANAYFHAVANQTAAVIRVLNASLPDDDQRKITRELIDLVRAAIRNADVPREYDSHSGIHVERAPTIAGIRHSGAQHGFTMAVPESNVPSDALARIHQWLDALESYPPPDGA